MFAKLECSYFSFMLKQGTLSPFLFEVYIKIKQNAPTLLFLCWVSEPEVFLEYAIGYKLMYCTYYLSYLFIHIIFHLKATFMALNKYGILFSK